MRDLERAKKKIFATEWGGTKKMKNSNLRKTKINLKKVTINQGRSNKQKDTLIFRNC